MHHTGVVTFLFTDIEGSTRLWEQDPEEMEGALSRHDAILRKAIEGAGGHIVKTTGDGVHAAFKAPVAGVMAALSAQQALFGELWPDGSDLRVRMALHTGAAEWREGDYYGPTVNRAARLMSVASGGQILLSLATAEMVRDRLPERANVIDLGRHRLKDLSRREQIYQLSHPDLPADYPPIKTDGLTPHNLPEQLTSFIGREVETQELGQLLLPEQADDRSQGAQLQPRLITLSGPGGTGKTRLSLHVARRVLSAFPDGVWLVELATLANPQRVLQSVAAPLGMKELPGRPLLDRLVDFLKPLRLLLILDNCEHLIDECARLAEVLLRSCPRLHILASSRESLGIAGEHVLRVRSLALPPEMDGFDPDEAASFEAVRLFVERAKGVRPDFKLTTANAATVSQICRRLDGIPLAIELAAARVRALSVEQIAARLDDRFRLLTGGSRTALPRQRTLYALIDWSYDLLSELECLMLQRLSVFSGGWTLEAAEAVAGVTPIERFEVLDLLEQLVNKSLVVVEENDWGARYGMLETIRQYAQEKLVQSGDAFNVRDRHLSFFVEQSEAAYRAIERMESITMFERLIAEAENLRSARAWALENDLLAAFRLQAGYSPRWGQVIPAAEALRYGESILEKARNDPRFTGPDAHKDARRLTGVVLASAANLAFSLGMNPLAIDYAQLAIEITREEGDVFNLGWALSVGATAASMIGDLDKGAEWLEEWFEECSRIISSSERSQIQAMTFVSLGRVYRTIDELDDRSMAEKAAWNDWRKGMAIFREAGDTWGQAFGHQMAAGVAMLLGDMTAAVDHAHQALAYFSDSGDEHVVGRSHSLLAEVARRQERWRQAVDKYLITLRIWRDVGQVGGAARCLECLAFIARATAQSSGDRGRDNRLELSARLLGAADAVRKAHKTPMTTQEQPEYDLELAALRDALSPEAFQRAWRHGQGMSLDEAVAFASEKMGFLT